MLDLIDPQAEHAQVHTIEDAWAKEIETQRQSGRFGRVMWISVFVLALLNSASFVTVVNGFGVGAVQDTVVAMADTWNEQMHKRGLDQPAKIIRDGVQWLHDRTWSNIKGHSDDQGAEPLREIAPEDPQS
ncbi:MAG: hypothetical protein ACOH12_09780 [Parvibaculaceae bacterium]